MNKEERAFVKLNDSLMHEEFVAFYCIMLATTGQLPDFSDDFRNTLASDDRDIFRMIRDLKSSDDHKADDDNDDEWEREWTQLLQLFNKNASAIWKNILRNVANDLDEEDVIKW